MRHPLSSWLLFGVCLLAVLVAMGWLTATLLKLDDADFEARRQAALEERVRLALWRAEAVATALVARESARAPWEFNVQQAVALSDAAGQRLGRGWQLSPLLTSPPQFVRLYFQYAADETLTSPQVPPATIPAAAATRHLTAAEVSAAQVWLVAFGTRVSRAALVAALPTADDPVLAALRCTTAEQWCQAAPGMDQQVAANGSELLARLGLLDQLARPPPGVGQLHALWIADELILVRRLAGDAQGEVLQGCWLDWPALAAYCRQAVTDLLPAAHFRPALRAGIETRGRMLAALPVHLDPGALPPGVVERGSSPIRLMLLVAWSCILMPAVAMGVLLAGIVSLNERRAAFFSAVTHELRTPLATFRMYTEMLLAGMVPEPKRQQYLETLRNEADRLAHMVENVLAYARLERGKGQVLRSETALADVFERLREQLQERAARAGMTLTWTGLDAVPPVVALVDRSAVERIVMNLVDNACKYAASAADRRIHLDLVQAAKQAVLRVRDHGPGIPPAEARRLFRPFTKSARDAAHSAPGVGLGLALSRRLARQMGGDLRLDPTVTDGACFVLTLPAGPE